MKQIEASIMGQTYVLGCPEGGEPSLMSAVGTVDREMCAIRDGGRVKARERIAVLAALNLAYALDQRASKPEVPPAADEPAGRATVDLDELVRKLDRVLGEDGRLL